MNSGWVFVSRKMFDENMEFMLVPAIANLGKKSKFERVFCVCSDVLYYSIRYALVRTAFWLGIHYGEF
jgi:hypothetical protein